jgi:hypothetical protein
MQTLYSGTADTSAVFFMKDKPVTDAQRDVKRKSAETFSLKSELLTS